MGNNNKVTDNNEVDDKVSFMSVNKQSNENGDIGNALELGRKKALHLQLTFRAMVGKDDVDMRYTLVGR